MNESHREPSSIPEEASTRVDAKDPRRCDVVRLAASQSFGAEEVALLDQIVKTLLRGGDARNLRRAAPFANLARKVQKMSETIERQRAVRATAGVE